MARRRPWLPPDYVDRGLPRRLLAAAETPRDRALIAVLYYAGLRASEAAALVQGVYAFLAKYPEVHDDDLIAALGRVSPRALMGDARRRQRDALEHGYIGVHIASAILSQVNRRKRGARLPNRFED